MDQYSTARLVSKLFLHEKFSDLQENKTRLENVCLLHPSSKSRQNFNLSAFSGTFAVKHDNIHIFTAVSVANF